MGVSFESHSINKAKGIDKLINSIDHSIQNRISPVNYDGIGAVYLEKLNKCIISFFMKDGLGDPYYFFGILYNLDAQLVEGLISQGAALGSNMGGHAIMFHPKDDINQYVWEKLTYKLFNVNTAPSITMIVNPESNTESNVFDNLVMTGNDKMFSDVTFSNSTDNVTENVMSATSVKLTRYYNYQNKKWHFSIPLISGRRRFLDDYLMVKFILNPARNIIVNLLNLKTTFRKTK